MLRSLGLLLKLNAQYYKDSALVGLHGHTFKCSEICLLDKMVQETRLAYFTAFTYHNLDVRLQNKDNNMNNKSKI